MEIKHWAATDVGRKRSHNEDNFLIDKNLNLFVVADGMGGHASGEVASAIAVHTIRDVVFAERDLLTQYTDFDATAQMELCTLLEYAVHSASARIFHKAQQEPEKRGMGTTVVALLTIGQRGFIAYVGDSRIYLSRNGVVYPLTEDHSLMNELIRSGKVRADEFAVSPYANFKNAMTRAVGVYEHVEVDILDFEILPGDAFLLCSDGLYDYLDDAEIASALALSNIEEIPGRFIDMANSRGGKDNITALVVQVAPDESSASRAAQLNFTLETLRRIPLMDQLSYQQLSKIMNIARMQPCRVGELLCREGTPGGDLYAVLEGAVTLSRGGVPMTTIHAGECFGETDLIAGETARATAIADKAGKLLKIGRRDVLEVLRRDPGLASKLLWNLARELGKRLEDAQLQLSSALGEDKTMVVDIDTLDTPDGVEETNPRAIVIPKLTTSSGPAPTSASPSASPMGSAKPVTSSVTAASSTAAAKSAAPKVNSGEPEILEEIDEFEDVLDEPG